MPASLSKSKAQKGRGASATEPQDGPWELLGTTSDELIDIGEKLQRSKKEQDRTLAVQVYSCAEALYRCSSGQDVLILCVFLSKGI